MSDEILYLDFGSNSQIDDEHNYDRLYKVGLKDQYEKLPFRTDYDDFVKNVISRTDVQVGISYPNFERVEPKEDKNRWFNIAVRISLEDSDVDVVLMCDLNEYVPKNKPMHRSLRVKGMTVVDSTTDSCGELSVHCDIYSRLVFNDEWYCDGESIGKYLSEEQINASCLTMDFLRNLNESYVVESPKKVIARLDRWQDYIDSKKEIIEKDQEICYSADEGTEVFTAYYKEGDVDSVGAEPIKHLIVKGRGGIWTRKNVPGSQMAPLLHYTHDFKRKDLQADEKIRKSFEKFMTQSQLVLSGKMVYKQFNDNKTKHPDYPNPIFIRNGRISSRVSEEEIQNKGKIDGVIKQYKEKIVAKHNELNGQYLEEVKLEIQNYVRGSLNDAEKEHREQIQDRYIQKCREERDSKVESETKRVKDAIEKQRAVYSDASSKIVEVDMKKSELASEAERIQSELTKTTNSLIKAGSDDERKKISSNITEKKNILKMNAEKLKALDEEKSIQSKRIMDCSKRLSDLESELKQIPKTYSFESMLESALATVLKRFREEKIEEYEEKCKKDLSPKYQKYRENAQKQLESERDNVVNDIIENETVIRMHVFFRLDAESNADSASILGDTRNHFKEHGMFMYVDYSGERAVLSRYAIALSNLRNGFVINPFLATALFNSSKQPIMTEADVRGYYRPNLNDKQKQAVRKALSSNGLFLIRGPPGTGKTEVIAEITAQLVSRGKKVLIASENHKAVDNAFERLPEIPTLRAVRLFGQMASKKGDANKFAVSKLTRNFYKDIAKCLYEEVRKTSRSQEYASKLDDILKDFESRSKEIKKMSKDVAKISKEIDSIDDEINRLNMKIRRNADENCECEAEIFNLQERAKSLKNGEPSALEDVAPAINKNLKGRKLSADQIIKLYNIKNPEINREFQLMEKHPDLFEWYRQKSSTKDEDIKKQLNVKILQYLDKNSIDPYEYKLLNVFPEGIPEKGTVLGLREAITSAVDVEIEGIKGKIDSLRDICNSTQNDENKLQILEKDRRRLCSDKAMAEYEGAKRNLESDIRKVISDNSIMGSFSTPEDGIDLIKSERRHIIRSATAGLPKDLLRSYAKMADYLMDESVIERDEETLNQKLLEYANVIGLTCTTKDNINTEAGNVDLKRISLDVVIVDEVSKISFLEILYPILYGKTVILVGDDKQLPPMYQSIVNEEDLGRYNSALVNSDLEKEFRHMYETSFFKELYDSMPTSNKAMLSVQYRMHPQIMDADNIFYDGQLSFGGDEGAKQHYLDIKGVQKKFITPDNHLVFIDVVGEDQKGYSGGTSSYNPKEVDVVVSILKKMEAGCRRDSNGASLGGRSYAEDDTRLSLGVICGYADQAKIIRSKIKGQSFHAFNGSEDERFMVDTIDNFQGDERDIIILSLVRSNPKVSFMTKFNRINVAISRARRLLIVVGNAAAFSSLKIDLDGNQDYVYRKIVENAKEHHGYFTASDILGE